MNIVGISAFYHESSCCLLRNGRLIAAASEERFTRVKHDPRLPVKAFLYCLRAGGLDITHVDAVAFYENPKEKLSRQLWSGLGAKAGNRIWMDVSQVERAIRERLGFEGPILYMDHHRSHAAAAYFFSGFEDAALLTIDGVGEWTTTAYGWAEGEKMTHFEEVHFPHSLGLLYATMTAYLGFAVNDGEYKVMGLAPYGRPRFTEHLGRVIQSGDHGQFRLDMSYFDYVSGDRMFSERWCDLFGGPPRQPESEITQGHMDLARSVQLVFEEILLEKVGFLAGRVGSEQLCLAGGAALNCVANGRIRREGPFKRIFVQPAAGDDGACLGAAALAHLQLVGQRPSREPLRHLQLGPSWQPAAIAAWLAATNLEPLDYRQKTEALLETVVDRLEQGQIIGWFHGPMEFGPRALGGRSILANPMDPDIRQRLNRMVKKREAFRPFAPSVLAEDAAAHFDLDHLSPFMLETCRVRSTLSLPGITHVDGSARPQTVETQYLPRYGALLRRFRDRTGCPLLVNTSFNVRGEPIVCSPADALFCMINAGLDALVLEDFLIERSMIPADWERLLPAWTPWGRTAFCGSKTAIRENLYTFV